jgi:hypothetical protein
MRTTLDVTHQVPDIHIKHCMHALYIDVEYKGAGISQVNRHQAVPVLASK